MSLIADMVVKGQNLEHPADWIVSNHINAKG